MYLDTSAKQAQWLKRPGALVTSLTISNNRTEGLRGRIAPPRLSDGGLGWEMVKDLSRQEKQIGRGMVGSVPVKVHRCEAKDAHWPVKEVPHRGFWEQAKLLGATSGLDIKHFPSGARAEGS